jgi:hypothetical protein
VVEFRPLMGGYDFWVSKEMLYKEKKKYYQPCSLPKSAFYITGFLNPNCHEWFNSTILWGNGSRGFYFFLNQITTFTYVLKDNFCPCFYDILHSISPQWVMLQTCGQNSQIVRNAFPHWIWFRKRDNRMLG